VKIHIIESGKIGSQDHIFFTEENRANFDQKIDHLRNCGSLGQKIFELVNIIKDPNILVWGGSKRTLFSNKTYLFHTFYELVVKISLLKEGNTSVSKTVEMNKYLFTLMQYIGSLRLEHEGSKQLIIEIKTELRAMAGENMGFLKSQAQARKEQKGKKKRKATK